MFAGACERGWDAVLETKGRGDCESNHASHHLLVTWRNAADGAENRAGQDGRPPVAVVGNKQRAGYCPSQANFGDASDRRKRFCARHRHTDVDLRKVPLLMSGLRGRFHLRAQCKDCG